MTQYKTFARKIKSGNKNCDCFPEKYFEHLSIFINITGWVNCNLSLSYQQKISCETADDLIHSDIISRKGQNNSLFYSLK